MSHIVKLGALEIAKDMIGEDSPMQKDNSKIWCAGFFAGLHETGAITGDELDDLTNGLGNI